MSSKAPGVVDQAQAEMLSFGTAAHEALRRRRYGSWLRLTLRSILAGAVRAQFPSVRRRV
jgi:hypothetical protein